MQLEIFGAAGGGGGWGGGGWGPKRGERLCHPPISNIHDYESYSVKVSMLQ